MNTSRYLTLSLATLALAFATLAVAPPSMAQALEEVLVTAQKKEENLQDVPISIATFTVEALETLRITGIDDLSSFTPGLFSIPNPTNPAGVRLTIRGLTVNNSDVGVDNKVALYQDGLYISKSQGISFDLADIERIEVLKGPQGTLYGRNAVAGAINLISKKASTEENGGSFDFTVGTYEEFKYRGSLNLAVSDNLAFKVSALSSQRAGWVENNGLGADFNGYDNSALRFDATILPMDDVAIHYAYEKTDSEYEPLYFQSLPISAPASNYSGVTGDLRAWDRKDEVTSRDSIETGQLDTEAHTLTAQWDWAENHYAKALFGYRYVNNQRTLYFFPEGDPDLIDFAFKNQLSFNQQTQSLEYINLIQLLKDTYTGVAQLLPLGGRSLRAGTVDNLPNYVNSFGDDNGLNDELSDHEQFSLELTQAGYIDNLFNLGSLDYTAGFYYLNEDSGNSNNDTVVNINTGFPILSLLPALTPLGTAVATINALVMAGQSTSSALVQAQVQDMVDYLSTHYWSGAAGGNTRVETEAFALYGQATWTPSISGLDFLEDRLHITAGIRYSHDAKKGRSQRLSAIFRDTTNLLGDPIALISSDDDYDSIDGTVNVRYDIADGMMVYFTIGSAFLSGGYNTGAQIPESFTFGKEEILSYEVGFKGDLTDYVRLNAAFFFNDATDLQQTITNPSNSVENAIVNGNAETMGVEVDVSILIPYIDGLSANLQYAWLDTESDDVINPFVGGSTGIVPNADTNCKGSGNFVIDGNCVNVRGGAGNPEHTISASVDYQRDLDDLGIPGTLRVHAGYNFNEETFLTNAVYKDSFHLVDLRVGVSDISLGDGSLDVALWTQNLLDDSYIINSILFAGGAGAIGNDVNNYGTPVTVGLDVKYTF